MALSEAPVGPFMSYYGSKWRAAPRCASWLPFRPLYGTTTTPKRGEVRRSIEAVWP